MASTAHFGSVPAEAQDRESLHGGGRLEAQLSQSRWVYLVGALLLAPLLLLFRIFARERTGRLELVQQLNGTYRGTARVLGEILTHDDPYTGSHSRGVAELSVRLADRLGLDSQQRRDVEFGALLHDVGKVAIPNNVINKPGPLDEGEWTIVKAHTVEGQRMLEQIGGLMSLVGGVVRSSHERFDGFGYPDGLRGEQIPIEARIICCADAFSAMTTDRPYREAVSTEQAIAELESCAGAQFDPQIVGLLAADLRGEASSPASRLPAPSPATTRR